MIEKRESLSNFRRGIGFVRGEEGRIEKEPQVETHLFSMSRLAVNPRSPILTAQNNSNRRENSVDNSHDFDPKLKSPVKKHSLIHSMENEVED